MLLREFLDFNDDMVENLRQIIMDYLTPFVARRVDFVSVEEIEDALHDYKSGLVIDRALVMSLLDPTKMKLVKKISGDRVYLDTIKAINSSKNADEREKEGERVSQKATRQARKEISK